MLRNSGRRVGKGDREDFLEEKEEEEEEEDEIALERETTNRRDLPWNRFCKLRMDGSEKRFEAKEIL